MHFSSQANICFGYKLNQMSGFPWSENGDDSLDPSDWWLANVAHWKPTVDIYAKGFKATREQSIRYYDERKAALQNSISIVNIEMPEERSFILGIEKTFVGASNGSPQEFDPALLVVTPEEVKALVDLVAKYRIRVADKAPKWYLSTYWDM